MASTSSGIIGMQLIEGRERVHCARSFAGVAAVLVLLALP